MKGIRIIICTAFLLLGFTVFAQYHIHFVVKKLPPYHRANERIFLAGSFNNWNPGAQNFALHDINGKPGITIELGRGMFEYKFTRGSWERVEWGAVQGIEN